MRESGAPPSAGRRPRLNALPGATSCVEQDRGQVNLRRAKVLPMHQTILIVAIELEALLGLAQAMLKFGYQIGTARPDAGELDKGAQMQPGLVVLRVPSDPAERKSCLALVKTHLHKRGCPVIACVADE